MATSPHIVYPITWIGIGLWPMILAVVALVLVLMGKISGLFSLHQGFTHQSAKLLFFLDIIVLQMYFYW